MKTIRRFQFEQYWFVGMLVGLVIMPWLVTPTWCPHALSAYRGISQSLLIKSKLFGLGWGIANVLFGLSCDRIGFALTGRILAGLGVSLGVTLPMAVKASGLFSRAPSLTSQAGRIVLYRVALVLVGVVLVSLAGFGRDRELKKSKPASGSFLPGLMIAVAAGMLSANICFVFVYSQGPVVTAMKAQGAGEIPANSAVWVVGLFGGALLNISYPAYLMTRNRSWNVLRGCWRDSAFAALIGVNFFLTVALMGRGMIMLGAMGASVGFGIQQAMQMLGAQGVGFRQRRVASGAWSTPQDDLLCNRSLDPRSSYYGLWEHPFQDLSGQLGSPAARGHERLGSHAGVRN
jgi:L-rhamnose-H+ transport protein